MKEKKIVLIDPSNVNSLWSRYFDVNVLEIQTEFKIDNFINAVKEGVEAICFTDKSDMQAALALCGDKEECVKLFKRIEDVEKLRIMGFKSLKRFKSIGEVPSVLQMGSDNINIDGVTVASAESSFSSKRFFSAGGVIVGRNLRLSGGELEIICGEGSTINLGNGFSIGNNVRIMVEKGASLILGDHCDIADHSFIYIRSGAKFQCGNGCSFGRLTIQGFIDINIGHDFLGGHGVVLRDGDGHDILGMAQPNYPKRIVIGDRVWMGEGVTILKGVQIGNDSVVANGSIVTKVFPDKSLIGGVPASILREGIFWRHDYSFYREISKFVAGNGGK